MKNQTNKIKLLFLMALMPLAALSQKADDLKTLTLDPAVRSGKLPNGFTYYIRHNEEPKNRVVMYLVNKAGSVLEDEDQRGLAHFMEHMSFNGTVHFPHNELVDYLQKAGVRFGADINAYTSFDETVYQLPLPSDKPEILNKGILIMHDWTQGATLDPVEIDKERGVVLEEKRLGKGAGERMERAYWPVILNHSRYAVRIPIGLDTVLNNFKRPVIERFYKDWYRPDLQVLIIVGDINADSLEKVVKARFNDLKNPAQERARPTYTIPLSGKNQFIAVTDKEMTATVAEVIIKHPLQPIKTAADYRNSIVQTLFNQMIGDRFAELSRQAAPPFVQAVAGISPFIGNLASFDLSVVAKPGELEKGFKAVWRETERLKKFGFTATELDRAKASCLSGMEKALSEKNKTNSESFVNEYQEYFLRAVAAPGIEKEYALTKAALPLITLDDVNALAETYISNANRDVLILAPEKDKGTLPGEAGLNDWIRSVEQENLTSYQDKVSSQPLLSAEPVSGKIVTEQKDKILNITTITLSNGVRVILKPTVFKNDEILFSAHAPGGTSLAADSNYQSAAIAASIIGASGAGNYSATELGKFLEGKQLDISPYISDRVQGISGSSSVKDLETALQLTYAYMSEPRKDKEIFDGIIARLKDGLVNRSDDPQSVFSDTISAVLGNYNQRRTGPSIEKLNQVNLDSTYAFYRSRFTDASDFTFTFVGSFDPEKIKPLLEKYLGGLPSRGLHGQAKDLGIHIPEGRIAKSVNKGSEPRSSVLLVYSGKFDYNPENKVRLDALKETLEIRLLERLREDESGVYSPGVSVNTTKYPQSRYSFLIHFGCAPENVEKLIASTLDEIKKLRTDGPLPENVRKWRSEEMAARETQLRTNHFWIRYLDGQLQNNESLGEVNDYKALLDGVNPGQLKETAKQYLSGDNYIRMVWLPFVK
jgi:zinc protease